MWNGANRLKFTPDGRLVFVSTLGGSDISIFDASSRALVKRVKVVARCGRYFRCSLTVPGSMWLVRRTTLSRSST